jgi:hypothetical protein
MCKKEVLGGRGRKEARKERKVEAKKNFCVLLQSELSSLGQVKRNLFFVVFCFSFNLLTPL